MKPLLPQHQQLLRDSAIDPAVAAARGYRSATQRSELEPLGFSKRQCGQVPALVVPVHNVHGEVALSQIRPDEPFVGAKGKPLKYETPRGARMAVDVPPAVRPHLGDPARPLWITEGVRKADAAVSAGIDCIALLGVWNWRGTNRRGGKTALACWDSIALNGREVFVCFDSDVMEKREVRRALDGLRGFLEGKKAKVKLVYLPEGPDAEKVGLDDFLADGHTAEDLWRLAKQPEPAREAAPSRYSADDRGTFHRKETHGSLVDVQLANFSATIVANTTRDDGSGEVRTEYEVQGQLGEKALPTARVLAEHFPGLGWVTKNWGSRAIVYAGVASKDHFRTAIQVLSPDAESRTVFTHTGWRRIGEQEAYLHAGGALGPMGPIAGVEVDLEGALAGIHLPEPPSGDDLDQAIRASLELLGVAPLKITAPLHAGLLRVVIGEADFSIHLAGATGILKSALAGVAQAHFGVLFDDRNLPASWHSTANALEGMAFLAKDVLLTVDDFAPRGSVHDVARVHQTADRIFRAQGNRSARARMRADGGLRPQKPPRGMLLSTGEDTPSGHSIRARLVVLELSEGDVNPERLTALQEHAQEGRLAAALAAFIQWLAPQRAEVLEQLRAEVLEWRKRSQSHRRTGDALGALSAAHRSFRRFAVEGGVLTQSEADALGGRVDRGLLEAGAAQAEVQRTEDPMVRFLDMVRAALSSGEAHLERPGGEETPPEPHHLLGWRRELRSDEVAFYRPLGKRIGWANGDDVYLDLEAAYKAAQQMVASHGGSLGRSPKTIAKNLKDRGLLRSAEERRTTTRPRCLPGRPRVLHLGLGTLLSNEIGPNGPNGPERRESPGGEPTGPEMGPIPGPEEDGAGPPNGPRPDAETDGQGVEGTDGLSGADGPGPAEGGAPQEDLFDGPVDGGEWEEGCL